MIFSRRDMKCYGNIHKKLMVNPHSLCLSCKSLMIRLKYFLYYSSILLAPFLPSMWPLWQLATMSTKMCQSPKEISAELWCICSDRFAHQASKPADAQTGLTDTVDALAEWGRNARMKTNDSAGRFVGVHHQVKLSHSIPQPQLLFSAPTDQFHVCESSDFSTNFCQKVKQKISSNEKNYVTGLVSDNWSDWLTKYRMCCSLYIHPIPPTVSYLNPCHAWLIARRGLKLRHGLSGLRVETRSELEIRNR